MTFAFDPQVQQALAPILAAVADQTPPAVGDVPTRRTMNDELMRNADALQSRPDDIIRTDYEVTANDGTQILARWYAKEGSSSSSGVLYVHGGGMIGGTVDLYDGPLERYVTATGVPMLSVDYRLAPEYPDPTPVTDAYAGLEWLAEHAADLGIDRSRIAIMGDSAGGGLAAGAALMTRDRGGPALSRQILIYPMLDDRNTIPDPEIVPFAAWTYDDNVTGWTALLGDAIGTEDVSPYAAPARADDAAGLPQTYIEVGELDIFRDEAARYALWILKSGVSTELHVRPGVPHHFDSVAPDTDIAVRARADRVRVLKSL